MFAPESLTSELFLGYRLPKCSRSFSLKRQSSLHTEAVSSHVQLYARLGIEFQFSPLCVSAPERLRGLRGG